MGELDQPKVEVEPGGRPYFVIELGGRLNWEISRFDEVSFKMFSLGVAGVGYYSFLRYIVTANQGGDLMYVFHLTEPHVNFFDRLALTNPKSVGRITLCKDSDGRTLWRKIHGGDIDFVKRGMLTRPASDWYRKNVLNGYLGRGFMLE